MDLGMFDRVEQVDMPFEVMFQGMPDREIRVGRHREHLVTAPRSESAQVIERPDLVGLGLGQVVEQDIDFLHPQFHGGDQEHVSLAGVIVQPGIVEHLVMQGDGDGAEPERGGLVDQGGGRVTQTVVRILAAVHVEIDLDHGRWWDDIGVTVNIADRAGHANGRAGKGD